MSRYRRDGQGKRFSKQFIRRRRRDVRREDLLVEGPIRLVAREQLGPAVDGGGEVAVDSGVVGGEDDLVGAGVDGRGTGGEGEEEVEEAEGLFFAGDLDGLGEVGEEDYEVLH